MGKLCPKCGTENPEDAKFCEDCGTSIPNFGSINEPVDEPVKKPIGKPVGKPVGKPLGKPVGKPVGKPADEPVQRSTRPKESEGFLSKHGLKILLGAGVCCVGILVILGIFGVLSLDQNTGDFTDDSSSSSTDSGSGTWHSVANFTGTNEYENTSSFNIKGSKFKLKISATAETPEYAYFSVFVYPEDGIYAGSESIDTFDQTTETLEYIVDEGSGEYYLSIIPANLEKWNIEVFDYY